MKVRELKERLEDIIEMGFGECEVMIKINDSKGQAIIAKVYGYTYESQPIESIRLYSTQKLNEICNDG